MNDEQARAALASLGGPLVIPSAEAHNRQSGRVLPHLRQVVRGIPARRRRKLRQRRAAVAAGLALSAALTVLVWFGVASPATPFEVEHGPAALLSDRRHGYSTGADTGATLRTRQGAHVVLAANTRLSAVSSEPQHELLRLASGSLSVRVPKLATGATFVVQTPDSVVTVHGTVFSVTVPGGGSDGETCVAVSEGLVAVEQRGKRTMVGAGEQHHCRPTVTSPALHAAESSAAEGTAMPVSPAPPPTPAHERHANAKQSAPVSSREADDSLAAQNRLLAAALQAERAGRFAESRDQLQELLARYPASPLRADAQRSLARVSRKIP